LDFNAIKEMAPLYHSNSIYTLVKYIIKIENGTADYPVFETH